MAHMIRVDDTEIKILSEYDVKVVHCPTTALKLVYELSNFGRFPEMMNAGVTVALGSDAPDCSNHHDMLRVLNLEVLIYKDLRHDVSAMSAEKVIEMATIHGAKAMGLEKEIGSLEKGKRADLIIFDTTGPEWVPMHNEIQNLVYSATGSSVETVIIDGNIVVENKTLKDNGRVESPCKGSGAGRAVCTEKRRFYYDSLEDSLTGCRKKPICPAPLPVSSKGQAFTVYVWGQFVNFPLHSGSRLAARSRFGEGRGALHDIFEQPEERRFSRLMLTGASNGMIRFEG